MGSEGLGVGGLIADRQAFGVAERGIVEKRGPPF
jgi:hypothetical protein